MLSLLLSALLVSAETPAEAPAALPASAEPAKKQKEKKICRKPEQATASNMVRRICLTESEWAKREQRAPAGDLKSMGSN